MTSKWFVWALGAALCVATGCGNRSHSVSSDAQEQERAFGSLHLPLVTPEQQAFRLRAASFGITRRTETVVTLDSESDPGATSLDADLLQGSYEITLRDGWRLERQGDAGAGEIVPAALLTPNPLAFDVDNARVTELVYSFATEQGVVTFGRGSASVSVAVTPTPLAACGVLDRSSCPNGQTCLFVGDSGQTYCAEPGSLPVGSPCSSEQCVAGAQCLSLDPSQPGVSSCARFCNPASRFCGCQGISADPGVGVCSESTPPGVLFSHDFVPGDSVLACADWNAFRNQLTSTTFARVTLSGSNGGSFECEDPGAASQICRALRNDSFTNVSCAGHSWRVQDCGGGPGLAVDDFPCSCTFPAGNNVRPCAGGSFGGVGTDTCGQIPQTIEVSCEPGQATTCGNGVIESPEVCDTNGAGPDVLPVGTPIGFTCSATCASIIVGGGSVCGNNVIEAGEACDTNGASVDNLPLGTPIGAICSADCRSIIVPSFPICGNNVIEAPEVCDTNGAGVDNLPLGVPVGSTCAANCLSILPPVPRCGNNVIDVGEACDTNGAGVDNLPLGTPGGSTCSANCLSILPPPVSGACLSCAQANCPTQFNAAVGATSTAENTASVTQLFDCVIGPNWEAGGPIPSNSCFFADPAQPSGSLVPCYCGSTPVSICLASGPFDNREACGRQMEIASNCNPVSASCVTGSGSSPNVPLGDALQLLNCERAACQAQCGFPAPPPE